MAAGRLFHDYSLAVWYGAEKRVSRLLPVAIRILRAPLKFGIGPLPFSPFQLARVPEVHWKDYLLKTTYVDLQLMSVNVGPGRLTTSDKLRMYQYCRDVGLPTIPVLFTVGNLLHPGDRSVGHVTDPEQFQALLASAPDRLFVKPVRGSHGSGAFVVTRDHAGFGFGGRHGTARQLFAHIAHKRGPRDAFLIQPQVRPHPALAPLVSANGLPTARLVTASVVDNFHNGLGGNLLAEIDLETGTLAPARGSKRRDWPLLVQVDSHPETGQRIAGCSCHYGKNFGKPCCADNG